MASNREIALRRLGCCTDPSVFLEIAALHASELSAGLLSRLRPPFLARLYRFLATDHFVFGAFQNEKLVGFISGTTDASKTNRQFLQSLGFAPLFSLFLEMIRPTRLIRALSLWKYLVQKPPANLPAAELLSLAVSPRCTRQGIGLMLVRALEEAFAEAKTIRYKVAASETQTAALLFYQRLGGQVVGTTHLGGLKTDLFAIEVTPR